MLTKTSVMCIIWHFFLLNIRRTLEKHRLCKMYTCEFAACNEQVTRAVLTSVYFTGMISMKYH